MLELDWAEILPENSEENSNLYEEIVESIVSYIDYEDEEEVIFSLNLNAQA